MSDSEALTPSMGRSQYSTSVSQLEAHDISSELVVDQISAKLEDEGHVSAQEGEIHTYGSEAGRSPPSVWSEAASNVPRRHMGLWQITALIINSIIGNGIFTQPGYILFLTKSKTVALSMWGIGGVLTGVTILIFVEFGIALPYNGGPMVYLDECFDQPRLLSLVIFSIVRIFLGSSESNCRALALNLLSLANPGKLPDDFSPGLISLVSVVVLAVLCLLLYFMLPFCMSLNIPLAIFKLCILIAIPICGLVAAKGDYKGISDFGTKEPGFNGLNAFQATIYVIYSYQGFINANCVYGEVKNIKRNLKYGALISISITTCLYMFLTTVLYTVLDYNSLTNLAGSDNATVVLFQKAFGSEKGVQAILAISAFGTLLIQIYTVARVKQAIAWRRIIPFYKFFGRQSSFNSPGGALLLHAVFTAIPLLAFNNSHLAVRSFVTGIYSWSHQIIEAFLGIGILRLRSRMAPGWEFSVVKRHGVLYTIAIFFAITNIATAALAAIGHTPFELPGWDWGYATGAVVGVGIFYWGLLRGLMITYRHEKTLGSIIGFEPRFRDSSDRQGTLDEHFVIWEAERAGMPRYVSYEVSGPLKSARDMGSKAYDYLYKQPNDEHEE